MNLQKYILSKPKFAKKLLPALPERYWIKQSEKTALRVFNMAKKRVPAYNDFLKTNGSNLKVNNIEDFSKLPVMNKVNYFLKYDLEKLCLDGKLGDKYTIEKSSGHTGKSFYWPRTMENDDIIPSYLEFAIYQSYNIEKYRTLIILTFALGTWTTGEKVADSVRKFAASGRYELTVVTPSANLEETLELLEDLSPRYQQTIIVGYPPFIKSVIDEAVKKDLNLEKLNIRIGLGGEGHSEHWREYIAKKIALKEYDLGGIASAYGAADIGIGVGHEYPLTIFVRKLAMHNKELAHKLFGDDSVLPCLYQYSSSVYVEEIEGELVFTALNGAPIVRYNIHDRGGVLTYDFVKNTCAQFGHDIEKEIVKMGYKAGDIIKFPMFYIFGRSDGTISIDGANIYPENIETVLYNINKPEIIKSYKLGIEYDEYINLHPVVHIEINADLSTMTESEVVQLRTDLHERFLKKLLQVNKDYKKSYLDNPLSSDLIIKLYSYGHEFFKGDNVKIKRNYIV